MLQRVSIGLGVVLALVFVQCSGSSGSGVTDNQTDGGGSTGADGGGTNPTPGADGGTGPTDPGTVPAPTACPTVKHKTLVIVGDSISDVGGGSNPEELPFYRTLLVANDDTKYPTWKGFDLATCAGIADANVVKASKGGAIATVRNPSDTNNKGVLLNQVTGLPTSLPGPVLVVGTIGGNDVQRGLANVVLGSPAQQQQDIDAFVAGFGAAMAELAKPDRFGAGVKADILMTNIYDPSGGSGNFYYEPGKTKCPGALGLWPEGTETAAPLLKWNTAMKAEAAKYAGLTLLEMHAPFVAHAVSVADPNNWFYRDCIHPSAPGHDAIRGIFWAGIVGLK